MNDDVYLVVEKDKSGFKRIIGSGLNRSSAKSYRKNYLAHFAEDHLKSLGVIVYIQKQSDFFKEQTNV